MNQEVKPIVVDQTFKTSKRVVWDAITQLEQMKQWFFNNIPSFEPTVGFQTKFDVRSGERNFRHLWRIIEVIPHNRIKYHWSYEDLAGEGFVTFDLFEQDDQTVLRLTNQGLETFPQDIPEFSRDSCESGWNFFIKNNLKDFLEKKI